MELVFGIKQRDTSGYYEVEGCVYRAALSFIYEEAKRSKRTGTVKESCSCIYCVFISPKYSYLNKSNSNRGDADI